MDHIQSMVCLKSVRSGGFEVRSTSKDARDNTIVEGGYRLGILGK